MKKIILVEDNPGIQDALSVLLRDEGYDVTVFVNAEPIMNNDYELPDIFILDKQLSGISGLDVCMHLKNNAHTQNIPVLMLSASPDIEKLAKLAGADAALEKPFRIKQLKELVAGYMHKLRN